MGNYSLILMALLMNVEILLYFVYMSLIAVSEVTCNACQQPYFFIVRHAMCAEW